MDVTTVILRVIHILAGVFWVGSTMLFTLLIEPTAAALGPQGGAFMAHLSKAKKYPIVMAISSIIAIAAGGVLYWRSSGHLSEAWLRSRTGITFTVGAIAAVVAWLIGFTVLRPAIERMERVREPAMSGDAAAAGTLASLQQRLRRGSATNFVLLVGTVSAMAAARYV